LEHEARLLFGFEDSVNEKDTTFCPGGMIFLRRMVFPPESDCVCLAADTQHQMPDTAFWHMFGESMQDLQWRMDPIFRVNNKPIWPHKCSIISRKLSTLRNPPENEDYLLPGSFVDLTDIITVQPLQVEWGPDVQQMHEPLSDDEDPVSQKALEIWRQFASDVIQKVGNPSGTRAYAQEDSYCILPPLDRLDITVENLKDPNLAKIFRVVFVKHITNQGWGYTFDYLFPPPTYVLPNSHQQYTKMCYYDDWMHLMHSIDASDVRIVHRAIKDKFNKLAWAPAAQAD
jgi:hypothetical protein